MRESSFSRAMALLDVPMVVVTASDGAGKAGCLVGFSGQSSIDPLRYVVHLSKLNHTYRVARRATHMWAHIERRHHRDGDHAAFVLAPVTMRTAQVFEPLRFHDVRDFHPGHPSREK